MNFFQRELKVEGLNFDDFDSLRHCVSECEDNSNIVTRI
ncbi:hypothetical protein NPIL_682201, partial [Nephila pilipes]